MFLIITGPNGFVCSGRCALSKLPQDRRKQQSFYQRSTLVYFLIGIITVAVILLYVHAIIRLQQHTDYRYELADIVINLTRQEIELLIKEQDNNLFFFAKKHSDLLHKISANSDSTSQPYSELTEKLSVIFPNLISFNMIDINDDLLITDWDNHYGEVCINNAHSFFRGTDKYKVHVHPLPGNYHYDLMLKIYINGVRNVLIVSQRLDTIENILQNYNINGFKLNLFNNSIKNQVEVSSDGVRGHNGVPITESTSEVKHSYLRVAIVNSHWELQIDSDGSLEKAFMKSLMQEYLTIFGVFLCIVSLFFIYIFRLNKIRISLFHQRVKKEENLYEQDLNLPLPYESIDADFNVVFVNKVWCEMLGYEQDDVIGQPLLKFYYSDSYYKLINTMNEYKKNGGISHDNYTMKHKDGEKVEIDIFSRFEYDDNDKFLSTHSILTNLTESSKACVYLRSLEQRHSLLWEQTAVGLIEWDSGLNVIEWNPAAERMFGFSSSEVMGMHIMEFLIPESTLSRCDSMHKKLLNHKGGLHSIIKNLTRDNGEIICEWFNTPLTDNSGKVIGISSLVLDVTTQRENLNLIQQHERELRQLIDNMVDGVITINELCIILSFNNAAEKIFGFDASSIVGKDISILIPVFKHHASFKTQYIDSGISNILGVARDVNAKRKNGEIFPMRLSLSELPNQPNKPRRFVASCFDVSEHQKMEEAVRQSRKLDAIGSMAGGISHDFNNLLGIISGNLEILKQLIDNDKEMNKWIENGLKATRRGAVLTKRLLGFSRIGAGKVSTIDIKELLIDMWSMIEKSAGMDVDVYYELGDNIWSVDIDSGDFEDAVINLVMNARDSINGKGVVIFTLYNTSIDKYKARKTPGGKKGEYVVLCISDTGSGFSKETKERMFDPFYTTKEKGKGTGLGLSMVHGFVRRSQGFIDVVSHPDIPGASFYVYLPRSINNTNNTNNTNKACNKLSKAMSTGSEVILVVDDEEQLVEVATIYLSDLGYKILQATGIEPALAILQSDEKIDLLFSDIIMPGSMDGIDLAEAAMELRPEIKVLLASGYNPYNTDHGSMENSLNCKRLNKPYNKTEVAQAVRTLLDGVVHE